MINSLFLGVFSRYFSVSILSNFRSIISFFLLDCDACYNDVLAAATECILSFDWKNCIEDILGGGSDCIECVCEVIGDIGQIFGQDWSC